MSISKTLLVLIALTGAQLASAKAINGDHNPPDDKTTHINQSVPPDPYGLNGQSVPPDPYGVVNGQSVPPDPYGVLNDQAIIKHNPPDDSPVLAGIIFHNPPTC